jgi:outer membrane cobalamin receptor
MQGLRWGTKNQWRMQHFSQWQALDFQDPDKDIDSESDIWSSILRLEHQSRVGEGAFLQSTIEWSTTGVQSTDYNGTRSRWSLSHRHSLQQELGVKSILRADVHQAFNNDFGWNWSGELGWNSKLSSALGIRFLSAKSSVIPTFNDLYWPNLGNPDLTSEQVYSLEAGLHWAQTPLRWNGGMIRADVQMSYYWNKVNNGIRWLPDEQGLSRPGNIEAITAHGLESDIALAFQHAQFSGLVKSGVYQVIARMEKERYEDDPALNKQLRYTPQWQFKHYAHLRYKSVQLMLSNSYVAERYSSADHSSPFDPLSSYSTWNAAFGIDIPWSPSRSSGSEEVSFRSTQTSRNIPKQPLWQFRWRVELNNIFSENYEQVLNYPMPGRHFMLSIQLNRVDHGSRPHHEQGVQ